MLSFPTTKKKKNKKKDFGRWDKCNVFDDKEREEREEEEENGVSNNMRVDGRYDDIIYEDTKRSMTGIGTVSVSVSCM